MKLLEELGKLEPTFKNLYYFSHHGNANQS